MAHLHGRRHRPYAVGVNAQAEISAQPVAAQFQYAHFLFRSHHARFQLHRPHAQLGVQFFAKVGHIFGGFVVATLRAVVAPEQVGNERHFVADASAQ